MPYLCCSLYLLSANVVVTAILGNVELISTFLTSATMAENARFCPGDVAYWRRQNRTVSVQGGRRHLVVGVRLHTRPICLFSEHVLHSGDFIVGHKQTSHCSSMSWKWCLALMHAHNVGDVHRYRHPRVRWVPPDRIA